MNQTDDEAIEALLRKQFDGPVPDEGFAERTMQRLSPRPRRVAWASWAGMAAGAGACWLSLRATPLLHAGWQDWSNGELSASAIALLSVMAGMSLLACWWTMMEAEDH